MIALHASLSRRFALLQWLLTLVVLAPVLLFTLLQLDRSTRNYMRQDVIVRSQSLLALYRTGGSRAVARSIDERLTIPQTLDKAYLIVDARGRRLAGNLMAWPADAPVPVEGVTAEIRRVGSSRPERAWMKTFKLPTGERLLVGSVALARTESQSTIMAAALAALLLMFAIVPVTSRLQARYLRRRIGEITQAATAFADGDLNRRIPDLGSDDECAELARSLNRTFDRLETLVEDLVFVTDALAHELRSPLTRVRAELDKLASAKAPLRKASVERVSAEIEGMLRTINATLELSRAEVEGASTFSGVNIAELVRELWEVYEPSAEQRGAALVLSNADACEVQANRDLLAQAVANLLDNALTHSGGDRIEIGCRSEPAGCVLWVADNGSGIPLADRQRALRKFGRLDGARTARGTGLGLTFVKVVADLHGGELALLDNEPGLRVLLRWGPGPPSTADDAR